MFSLFLSFYFIYFFFTDTSTTTIYTLSLHDALPISKFYERHPSVFSQTLLLSAFPAIATQLYMAFGSEEMYDNNFNIAHRSEEHTSELQSRFDLVCRLLLEKKKK